MKQFPGIFKLYTCGDATLALHFMHGVTGQIWLQERNAMTTEMGTFMKFCIQGAVLI